MRSCSDQDPGDKEAGKDEEKVDACPSEGPLEKMHRAVEEYNHHDRDSPQAVQGPDVAYFGIITIEFQKETYKIAFTEYTK